MEILQAAKDAAFRMTTPWWTCLRVNKDAPAGRQTGSTTTSKNKNAGKMPAAQNKSLAEGEAQYFTRKFYRIVIESSRQRSGAYC